MSDSEFKREVVFAFILLASASMIHGCCQDYLEDLRFKKLEGEIHGK